MKNKPQQNNSKNSENEKVRSALMQTFFDLRNNKIRPDVADSMARVAGEIRGSVMLEIIVAKARGEAPVIPHLMSNIIEVSAQTLGNRSAELREKSA